MKVAILGLGVSGRALAKYLHKKGDELLLIDRNPKALAEDPVLSHLDIYPESHGLEGVDLFALSPGIPLSHPLVMEAKKRKIPITSEIEVALRELAKKEVKIYAITGSNGKTTTTMLCQHLTQKAGESAGSFGNIGTPLCEALEERFSSLSTLFVELSSFQLSLLPEMNVLDGALILNISANHLDHHKDFEEYFLAKLRIEKLLKLGAPLHLSDEVAQNYQHLLSNKRKIVFFEKRGENLAFISSLSYREEQFKVALSDRQDWLAALSLCEGLAMTEPLVLEAASTFQKLPHRFEFVCKRKGVSYFNDSKATTVDAVLATLDSMKKGVWIIVGGHDKGGDFTRWKRVFKEKVEEVFVIGSASKKIMEQLGSEIRVTDAKTLSQAVEQVAALASGVHPGVHSVLLSPGCASFDQFKNYEVRGQMFKEYVLTLKDVT